MMQEIVWFWKDAEKEFVRFSKKIRNQKWGIKEINLKINVNQLNINKGSEVNDRITN